MKKAEPERVDPHHMQTIQQLIKQVGVDRLQHAIASLCDESPLDIPRFTKIRTADLSAMTDLLTDAYMAFEDIIKDLTNGAPVEAKGRARGMAIELRNWRPTDEKE